MTEPAQCEGENDSIETDHWTQYQQPPLKQPLVKDPADRLENGLKNS